MSWRRTAVALLALGALAAGWWLVYGRGPEVTAVAPVRGTAVEIVYATGAVEPVRWAKVAQRDPRPHRRDLRLRGQDRSPRATCWPASTTARCGRSSHELQAREEFAKREMSRVTELIGRGVATTQAYERASMDLRQIQALISVQIEKLADYTIAAPMDGVVLRRDGEVGEIAEAGQILFRVGVPKPLQVVAEVNEEDIPRVARRPDRAAAHRRVPEPAPRRQGARDHADGRSRSPRPTASASRCPTTRRCKPGMSVEANVVTREKPNALLVPADAVQGDAVFVDRRRPRAQARRSRSASAARARSRSCPGSTEGERVASPAPPAISPTAHRVRVVDAPASAP